MKFTKPFEKISKRDVSSAGGKGASLGEMIQAGIPVPSGFVVTANAFEKFLEETDLNVEIDAILDSADHKEMHTIENASEKIKALILQAEIPQDITDEIRTFFKKLKSKYTAVRSSATAEDSTSAAWAGQLESYLNTPEENLLENVKKCWASLFTPRAIFYRLEKNMRKLKISVAVVVQKMVQSEVAGVCFTVHPVTRDYDQLVIEAGYGLGEAIVSGKVTPDTYVLNKKNWQILDKNIGTQKILITKGKVKNIEKKVPKYQQNKQKLSDTKILLLGKLCKKIEDHYKKPQDVEWAFYKDQFYIVQSRPITTL
ncbi:MAG: hypothetical protein EXS47_02765 [Candidatus Zambryskibacteria bacterium]|nr:hypothetical protein [Candidatus Zambryskibacteria bacterium]